MASTTRGVSRNSGFVSWLSRKRKGYREKEGTHLLLSGGSILVEPGEENEVLDCLAKDMDDGLYNYVIEKRTPVFRFCQDWDFICYENIPTETLLQYYGVVQEVLSTIFPDIPNTDKQMVICSAPIDEKQGTVQVTCKKFTKGLGKTEVIEERFVKQNMVKCGIHTYFPNIYVTQEDAIRVRFILLHAMEHRFPRAFEQVTYIEGTTENSEMQLTQHIVFDTWDKILDLTIYTANGLRMLGSRKAEHCCRKDTGDCEKCQGGRYIDKGRPYEVTMVVDSNAECLHALTDELIENNRKALELTTIRTNRTDHSEPVIPVWFTNRVEMMGKIKQFCGGRRRRANRPDGAMRGENDLCTSGWGAPGSFKKMRINNEYRECEVLDTQTDARARRFQQFLRDHMDSVYGDITLSRMMICMVKGYYRIYAVPTTRYCINVQRPHHGQEIFFLYSERGGVVQRCWSSKDSEDRLHGSSCTSEEARLFFKKRAIKMNSVMESAIFSKPGPILDLDKRSLLPPPNPDSAGGTMEVLGDRDLDVKFKDWYSLHSVGAKRKFSWFSADPDTEMREKPVVNDALLFTVPPDEDYFISINVAT
jgi:hypothetical protein